MKQRIIYSFLLLASSQSVNKLLLCFVFSQEGSENEEEEREEEEEENTDYLTDSNKENETDEDNNVRIEHVHMKSCR